MLNASATSKGLLHLGSDHDDHDHFFYYLIILIIINIIFIIIFIQDNSTQHSQRLELKLRPDAFLHDRLQA